MTVVLFERDVQRQDTFHFAVVNLFVTNGCSGRDEAWRKALVDDVESGDVQRIDEEDLAIIVIA